MIFSKHNVRQDLLAFSLVQVVLLLELPQLSFDEDNSLVVVAATLGQLIKASSIVALLDGLGGGLFRYLLLRRDLLAGLFSICSCL